MKQLLYAVPALALAVLGFFFFRSLNGPPPDELPSALVDKPAPATPLPALDTATTGFVPGDLRAGHVTVVNVWASWCVPCRAEAPALASLSQMKGIALYGIVYEDTANAARAYLRDVGNPFSRIDLDSHGQAGIDWGVYGVPETFVIDGRGIVRLRYAGPIVGDTLASIILPAIARARAAS
jgi:cytochrome c biogenesis protein CcmG/thiol:disulfide interchange protein DsbE